MPCDAVIRDRQDQLIVFETKNYNWIKKYLGTEKLIQIEKHVPSVTEIYKEVMKCE